MIDATPLTYATSVAYLGSVERIIRDTERYFGKGLAPTPHQVAQILKRRAGRTTIEREAIAPPAPPEPKEKPAPALFLDREPGRGLNLSVISDLKLAVAKMFRFSPDDLYGPSRHSEYVTARAVLARLLLERGLSTPKVARLIGRIDHSTVINLRNTFDSRAKRRPEMLDAYSELKARGA